MSLLNSVLEYIRNEWKLENFFSVIILLGLSTSILSDTISPTWVATFRSATIDTLRNHSVAPILMQIGSAIGLLLLIIIFYKKDDLGFLKKVAMTFCLLPLVLSGLLPFFLKAPYFHLILSCASSLTLLLFCWHSNFDAKPLYIYLATFTVIGVATSSISFSSVTLLGAFLLWLIIFRVIYLAWSQNKLLLYKTTARTKLLTIYYWLPFLAFAYLGVWANSSIKNSVENTVYFVSQESDVDFKIRCFDHERMPLELSKPIASDAPVDADQKKDNGLRKCPTSLHKNTIANINELFDQLHVQMQLGVESTVSATTEATEEFPQQVESSLQSIVPKKLFNKYPGGDFPSSGWIKRKIMKAINKSYRHARSDSIKDAKSQAREYTEKSNEGAKSGKDYATNHLNNFVSKLRSHTIRNVDDWFGWLRILNTILAFWLFVILLKGLLHVFIRVSANEIEQLGQTFNGKISPARRGLGKIKPMGSEYKYSLRHREKLFYYDSTLKPSGVDPKSAWPIPQWNKLVVDRLGLKGLFQANIGKYFLNEVDLMSSFYKKENKKFSPIFGAIQGEEYIEWKIDSNQEVIFDISRLVILSKGITLKRVYNFRFTSLLFGTVRFASATGPGILVLKARGKPGESDPIKLTENVAPQRLLAWDSNTVFRVDANIGWINIYFNSVQISSQRDNQLIIDADAAQASSGRLIGFLKWCVLP